MLNGEMAVFLIILLIKLVSAGFPITQVSTIDGVPENWHSSGDTSPFVKIGVKYYYIENRTKSNWFEAAHICRRMNANLASIESEVEFEAITKYIRKQGYDLTNFYWLSANDLGEDGKYFNLGTGKPMNYAKWSPGNPDHYSKTERCVHIWCQNNVFSMNDYDCKALTHYICQANTPRTLAFTVW